MAAEPPASSTPGWLDDVEQRAWMALLVVVLVGMPELERTFRRHGLVQAEYGLLAALSTAPDGMRLTDLARGMNLSASRVTHRMRKLVERGFVEVVGDPCDGRVSIARITVAGHAFTSEVAPVHVGDVRRLIFDHLDRRQVAALADALGTVAERIGGCVGPPVPPAPATPTHE